MFIHLDDASLAVAGAILPADQPIFMLNLLRYRKKALYAADSGYSARSGREAYFTGYVPAFQRLTAGQGITPHWLGSVGAMLVGTEGEWDDAALIRYPNFEAFRRWPTSAEYKREAEPHRLAALADWRLIAMTEMKVPG